MAFPFSQGDALGCDALPLRGGAGLRQKYYLILSGSSRTRLSAGVTAGR